MMAWLVGLLIAAPFVAMWFVDDGVLWYADEED